MKIGFFTDSHYSSQALTCGKRYNNKSLLKVKDAYSYFEQNKCDLVICLGDLIDKEDSHEKEAKNLKQLAEIINSCPIKTICLMGNHDAFAFTKDEFYGILGTDIPQTIVASNKKLIFLDACHFKNGNHYMPGDTDWTDTFYPDTQFLKEEVSCSDCDIYVLMHQNIDPEISSDHRLHNAEEILDILSNNSNVKAVFQGHYHNGNKTVYNNINFVTFPAMCENEKAYFIEEI